MDLGKGCFEEAVQQGVHALRPESFGQIGGADQVAEKHADELSLAFQSATRGEDLPGQMGRRVGVGRSELGRIRWRNQGSAAPMTKLVRGGVTGPAR
jgi:hypothetical protein